MAFPWLPAGEAQVSRSWLTSSALVLPGPPFLLGCHGHPSPSPRGLGRGKRSWWIDCSHLCSAPPGLCEPGKWVHHLFPICKMGIKTTDPAPCTHVYSLSWKGHGHLMRERNASSWAAVRDDVIAVGCCTPRTGSMLLHDFTLQPQSTILALRHYNYCKYCRENNFTVHPFFSFCNLSFYYCKSSFCHGVTT